MKTNILLNRNLGGQFDIPDYLRLELLNNYMPESLVLQQEFFFIGYCLAELQFIIFNIHHNYKKHNNPLNMGMSERQSAPLPVLSIQLFKLPVCLFFCLLLMYLFS